MSTYRIVSIDGIDFGTYEGLCEVDALDAMAREAGYQNWSAGCQVTGSDDRDWTSDLFKFRGGQVALLVVQVAP
jgi:hypothetical protein